MSLAAGAVVMAVMNTACAAIGPGVLRCDLKAPAQVVAGQPLPLHFTLGNSGTEPLEVLVWGTPFESRWLAPYVRVERDGVALPYGGASMKRGDPSAANYLRIEPGRSRDSSVDLAVAFDLTVPGHYRVQPQLTLHDVMVGVAPNTARPRAEHHAITPDCNGVEFVVTRSVMR